jgi:D-alanine-D-alanine ligase-like ATP-grasp enzyme
MTLELNKKNTKKPSSMEMLREYCQHAGVQYTTVDEKSKMFIQIERDGRYLNVSSKFSYPLNLVASSKITQDKIWASMLLEQNGYMIPEGKRFFTVDNYRGFDTQNETIDAAITYANRIGYPVFSKPNKGSKGRLAKLVNSDEDLRNHFKAISQKDHAALVQRPIHTNEFRLFVLGDKVEFTYRKSRPEVIGDGKLSIRVLIKKYNQNTESPVLENDQFLESQLTYLGFSLDSILIEGKSIAVSPNSNPNSGGQIIDYNQQISPALEKWAVGIIQLFGLRVAGIDIFGEDLNTPSELTVLEINSMPALSSIYMLGHKDKVFDIWGKMIELYFSSLA